MDNCTSLYEIITFASWIIFTKKNKLWRNVQKILNALGGFHPPPLRLPKNAIPPEQVKRHQRSQRRGGKGGQELFPPSSIMCFLFHFLIQGILHSRKNNGILKRHLTFYQQRERYGSLFSNVTREINSCTEYCPSAVWFPV